MTRVLRDIRIIPIVLIAISALFLLKSFGLIFDGGYTLSDWARNADDGDITGTVPKQAAEGSPPAPAVTGTPALPPRERSWAQQVFNFPDMTGSVGQPTDQGGLAQGREGEAAGTAADAGRHANPDRRRPAAVAGRTGGAGAAGGTAHRA